MSSEKNIQNQIIKYLKQLDSTWYVKNIATIHSRHGLPDLFVMRDGLFYAFEVKTLTGKVTKRQIAELEALQAAGALTAIVRSVDDVKTIFAADRRRIVIEKEAD